MSGNILSFDVGSTGCKTCLYRFSVDGDGKPRGLELLASALSGYELIPVAGGGMEQDPDDWWRAMVDSAREIFAARPEEATAVRGVTFCAQMQGLVLVDEGLRPLRPAMSYLDQRAGAEKDAVLGAPPRIEGMNAVRLLKGLSLNGAVAASAKDPVWKYAWVRKNEPEIFARVHKWLDVKDYLIARATGECAMTGDSAFATFLTSETKGRLDWHPALLRMYGVEAAHLPRIIGATDVAGTLLPERAAELGLPGGVPVFGGGGDASMIGVGAGATGDLDCHVYTGTSGWVSCVVDRRAIDVNARVASIVGPIPGRYNYFAEQETAGKCLEWVRDHLAKDEINLYLDRHSVVEAPESTYKSMYDFLIETIGEVPPGSNGVLFAPWLHGNRSPFEDPAARAMFFNVGLENGKRDLIRAVVEGIVFHQKWLFESIRKKFPAKGPLRFAGGGALSPEIARIIADVFGETVAQVADPQNCGAAGAAWAAAVGLGWLPGFDAVRDLVPLAGTFEPDPATAPVYASRYGVFKGLYGRNKKLFAALNATKGKIG